MAGTVWVADADVLAPVVDMDEAVYGVQAKSRCYDYRVLRHWIAGARRGDTEPLIENLPGFPDNLSAGLGGRFWLALILPRNKLLDQLSDAPLARTMIQRLPTFFRPSSDRKPSPMDMWSPLMEPGRCSPAYRIRAVPTV